MSSSTQLWVGRIVSALVVLFLLFDGGTGLLNPASLAPNMAETGCPATMIAPLSVIILACAIVYAVPQTAVLGAILVAAFAGGAIATHFRLGEMASPPQLLCAGVAILAWGGLWLRDPRLRTLLPLS